MRIALLAALLVFAGAAAYAKSAHAMYCDVEYRSCLGDSDGGSMGDSYPGTETGPSFPGSGTISYLSSYASEHGGTFGCDPASSSSRSCVMNFSARYGYYNCTWSAWWWIFGDWNCAFTRSE